MTAHVDGISGLRVAKRRVDVHIRLADQRIIAGGFYTAGERLDGERGTVLDRLCDPREKYLPLAVDHSHVMLSKAQIVTVQLEEPDLCKPRAQTASEFLVLIDFDCWPPASWQPLRLGATGPHSTARPPKPRQGCILPRLSG